MFKTYFKTSLGNSKCKLYYWIWISILLQTLHMCYGKSTFKHRNTLPFYILPCHFAYWIFKLLPICFHWRI